MIRRLIQKTREAAKIAFAWSADELRPSPEKLVFDFKKPSCRAQWSVHSDKSLGGLSEAYFSPCPEGGHSVFFGNISTELTERASHYMRKSGFVGIRTVDRLSLPELEAYSTIAMRLKGDGRAYISTLRTDSWVGGPTGEEAITWQAFVIAPKDEWHVTEIPLDRYLMTWKGKIVESNSKINLKELVGLGFSSVAQSGPPGCIKGDGSFKLEIDWIKCLSS